MLCFQRGTNWNLSMFCNPILQFQLSSWINKGFLLGGFIFISWLGIRVWSNFTLLLHFFDIFLPNLYDLFRVRYLSIGNASLFFSFLWRWKKLCGWFFFFASPSFVNLAMVEVRILLSFLETKDPWLTRLLVDGPEILTQTFDLIRWAKFLGGLQTT